MKIVKIIITILLFGLVIYSCKKEKVFNPEPQIEYSIIGEWIWKLSCGGFGGDCFTPENTGNTLSITFTQDDSVIIVANSDTVIEANYLVRKGKGENYITSDEKDIIYINCDTAFTTQEGYFLVAPENLNRFVIISLNDTLSLQDDCCDCYGHIFTRKKNNYRQQHL
jgi:hypothetical protein